MNGPSKPNEGRGSEELPRGARELGRALSLSSVSRAAAMIIALTINGILARALTQSEFAFFGVLIAFSSVFVIFLQLGYQTGITKIAGEASHAGDEGSIGEAVWASTLAVLAIGLASLPMLILGRDHLFPPVNGATASLDLIVLVTAYCVSLAIANLYAEAIRGLGHVGSAASLTGMGQHGGVVRGAIILAGVATLASLGDLDLGEALIIASLASLVAALLSLGIIARTNNLLSSVGAVGKQFRSHLPTNLQLMIGQGLQIMASQHAMLIVGGTILSGPPLALLVAAQQVRNILTAPLTLFNGAAPKLMIHAYRDGDSEELQSIVRLGSSFATVIVICLAPPFLLVGNFIFTLLFGQLYADSAYYFALLIPGLLAFAVGGSGGRMMVLLGRQKEFMVYSACIAGLSIPMLAWSASNYGASGISIATSVLLVLQNAILVLLVRRYFGIWSHAYLAPQRYFELGRSALALIRRKLGKAGGKGKSQK